MLLEAELDRVPRDILSPGRRKKANPTFRSMQGNRLTTCLDQAIQQESADVPEDALECGHSELMDNRADCVAPGLKSLRDIKRVKALEFRKRPRRPLVNAPAIHIESVSCVGGHLNDRAAGRLV